MNFTTSQSIFSIATEEHNFSAILMLMVTVKRVFSAKTVKPGV